jgi:hypothetical protein
MFVGEEKLTKTAFLMLSYGLCVTLEDLETVYRFYGYCDLFRLLLRMDVQFCDGHKPSPMVLMYCDPSTDLALPLDDSSFIAVPILVETARNAARKYIARNFKIKTPKQFYSIIDRLPIDRRSKRIIALETKLN